MRFEYGPETHGPEMASAEAQQQIAVQLERIADALESDDRDFRADGGQCIDEADQCDMPECDSSDRVRAVRDPGNNLREMCHGCRKEWPVQTVEPATEHVADLLADAETETVPWCPSCESFSVPVADESCGQCGSTVEFAGVDRWA